MLTNVETNQQKLIQVLLVGQPELDRKLGFIRAASIEATYSDPLPVRASFGKKKPSSILNVGSSAGATSQANTIFPTETVDAVQTAIRGVFPRLINNSVTTP